jgi:2,3-bisphosphoglycerate-dependent phosphoglycerate mutase
MSRLILLRHGQSLWNKEGRFTGWKDVDLSAEGIAEARRAGRLLRCSGYAFDVAYTSFLKRAIRTLWIVQEETDLMWIPVVPCWQLNERCYGALEGKSKKETEERYGDEQVHLWRRGFKERPPALDDEAHLCMRCDPRYVMLESAQIPRTESLEDTLQRMLPCWQNMIAPDLRNGMRVIIVSHGNTLRALVKLIDGISDEEIERVEVPTGISQVYELDEDLRPKARFFLRNREGCKKIDKSN